MTWWCQWLTLIHCRGDDIDARENILSKKLLEAGCECCDSSTTLRELLADVVKDIHEQDVAIALGSMAQSYADGTTSGESNWNVENFVAVIVDLVWARWLFTIVTTDWFDFFQAPAIDWEKVIQSLDYGHFIIYDAKSLGIIIRAWKHCPKVCIDTYTYIYGMMTYYIIERWTIPCQHLLWQVA